MIKKITFVTLLTAVIGAAYSQQFPAGNYWDSCRGFEWLTPTSMAAHCEKRSSRTGDPEFMYSVLEVVKNGQICLYVQNIDGVLTCTPGVQF